MNMLGLSSSVRIAHIACYWKFFLLHCVQVLCQYRLCSAGHVYLTYLMLERQLSHLNSRKLWQFKSKSKFCYDRRLVEPPSGAQYQIFLLSVAGLLMWVTVSEERTGLSFTIAAGSRQRSHSRARVPLDSWSYFTVWDSRLSQPGGLGPRIYTPQEQGGPVIPQALGSLFVISNGSQGYGGGIRTRLHTGLEA
jgi:hypothetical protein